MVEHIDLLNTLAQIALGVLGFSGVVLALKQENTTWETREKIGFQALVTTTLTALVGALLPQVFSTIIEDRILIWRLANLGIGLLHLLNFGVILFAVIRYSKLSKLKPEISVKGLFDTIIGFVLIILHFVGAAGYIPWLEFLLILGVLQQLYIGIGNFLTIVWATK